MKYFLPLFTLLLFWGQSSEVSGQARGNNKDYNSYQNPNYTANSTIPQAQISNSQRIVIDVRGLSNQRATQHLAIFSLTQQGKDAQQTNALLKERREKFSKALQGLGIEESSIFVDMISFVPIYDYEVETKVFSKSYNEVPKGFELEQNMHIAFKDESLLPELIAAAAEQEIYDLVKVDYFVENNAGVYKELRKACIAYAQEVIKDYEKLGIQLDTVYRVVAESKSVVYPDARYSSYQAFSRSAVPTKGKVQDYQKNTTVYYDKLPYNQFDLIINPALLEPAVQFTYHLKVQFELPPKQARVQVKQQREFMWLTPEGELRRLKVE